MFIARAEAVRLAKHVLELSEQLTANEKQLDEPVNASEAAPLLAATGVRAISAAKCLAAWSHEPGSAARRLSPAWPG